MLHFRSYVICTSPRSGSTLLCKLLQEVGTAGFPGSHFHAPSLEAWLGYYGLNGAEFTNTQEALKAVVKSARKRGMRKSSVFGLRMQGHSFKYFLGQLHSLYPTLESDKERIEAAFGRSLFVHLTRENKLDQAISYVRATQSGLWHRAADGTELERLSKGQDPVFDRATISAQLEASKCMDAAWTDWFATENITPLRVSYSELSAAPYETCNRVLSALGLDRVDDTRRQPPVAKLADRVNREWAERYLSDADCQPARDRPPDTTKGRR